jgi:DNA-directed RNA polymerase subunit F
MLALSDEATTQKLDAIDKVRLLLSELRDTAFYEEILSTLPQFVACGPQSGGKSSVIRRLSGISLPEASTLCTRVATVISMRREGPTGPTGPTGPAVALRVTLSGPSGVLMDEELDDFGAVRPLVAAAQEIAREKSNKAFVDDHVVTVYATGPAMPNLTLVDLPGFHTADDSDARTVNEMVARYIHMPGTLAMHIVKGDQDYDSLLGNDFMRKLSVPRVTVLTHCDKIENTADGRARIAATLDRTSENSSGTFAVDGTASSASSADASRETEALRFVQQLDCRVEVGVEPLARHLEERMREHLLTQFPKAVAKLRASLVDTVARSAAIKPKAPIEEVHEMARTVVANLEASRPARMDDVRSVLERMTLAINNHKIRPVTDNIQSFYRKVDEFDEVAVGSSAYCMVSPDSKHVSKVTIKALVDDKDYRCNVIKCAKWKTDDREGESRLSDIYSGESFTVDAMVEDITALARRRGVRNLVHADRLPIIAAYAKQFAEHYTKKIREAADELRQIIRASVDAAFKDNVCESAKHAAAKLRTLVADEETNADAAISALEQYNSEPDLLFTPNEHYLNSLIQQMVAADDRMASDKAGARHIWHNVRAYIKVQRKFVSELAAKELVRLVLDVERRCRAIVQNGHVPDLACLVTVPPSLVREREMLRVRQNVLEQALSVLAPL